ncbi:MAG: DUF2520 domain-containing protein [Eudoraea sp.]|nr:DUF2520 domain-containing protein [Eudoraea sp.]
MIKVVLLGTGNVARYLYDSLCKKEHIELIQVVGRNESTLDYFKHSKAAITDFSAIKPADVYILAIKDDAIAQVSETLALQNGLLVHTSGSVAMNVLPNTVRRGVLYPLQTFSNTPPYYAANIPFCIEAEEKKDLDLLEKLALSLSDTVHKISSDQRLHLHLAAVFANNFTNHMYYLANKICEENAIPFSTLESLIKETTHKITTSKPFDVQTGPAKRGDTSIIKKHLELLQHSKHQEIYSLLSESIQDTYGNEL